MEFNKFLRIGKFFRETSYRIKIRLELAKLDSDTFRITWQETKKENERRNNKKGK